MGGYPTAESIRYPLAVMRRWSAALAATLLGLGLIAGAPVNASTPLEQARQEKTLAASRLSDAERLISSTVARRDRLEARLLVALDKYERTSDAIEEVGYRIASVEDQIMSAGRDLEIARDGMQQQVSAAYIHAVSAPGGFWWGADSFSLALVADEAMRSAERDNLGQLDDLVLLRTELADLQLEFGAEQDQLSSLLADQEAAANELQTLFGEADADLAAAYARLSDAKKDLSVASKKLKAAQKLAARPPPPSSGGEQPCCSRSISAKVRAWEPVVAAYFPNNYVEQALSVMQCESGGNPDAFNPHSGASGLFQFLPGTWTVVAAKAGFAGASPFNGEANIASAAWLVDYSIKTGHPGGAWGHWGCDP